MANKGDFKANISKNGLGRKVVLSDEDRAVGLEFAGVDIMKDEEGKTHVVEVNGNPGTKIINITGYNYFLDLIKLIEQRVGNGDENTEKVSAFESNGVAEAIKLILLGQKDLSYSNLTLKEMSKIENLKRLKIKYHTLMKDIEI